MKLEQLYEGANMYRTSTDKTLGDMNRAAHEKDVEKSAGIGTDPSEFAAETRQVLAAYHDGEQTYGAYTVGNSEAVNNLASAAIADRDVRLAQAVLFHAIKELPKLRARLPFKVAKGRNNVNDDYYERVKHETQHMQAAQRKVSAFLEQEKTGTAPPSLSDVAGKSRRR